MIRERSSSAGTSQGSEAIPNKSELGPPPTLGAAAGVRLIVWCKECQHQVEPDPAKQARRYGEGTAVLDWRERLVCSRCGSRQVDMVVSGTSRR